MLGGAMGGADMGARGRHESMDWLGAMSSTNRAIGSTALMRLSVYIIGFFLLSCELLWCAEHP